MLLNAIEMKSKEFDREAERESLSRVDRGGLPPFLGASFLTSLSTNDLPDAFA